MRSWLYSACRFAWEAVRGELFASEHWGGGVHPAQGPWEGMKEPLAGIRLIERANSFGLKSCRNAWLFSITPLTCWYMWKSMKAPVCYPFPRASFRAQRGCSACPRKQYLWYLLGEDGASHLPHQELRELIHKLEGVVWFPGISAQYNSPLEKLTWISLAFD